jgi:hypothetical protein
VLAEVMVVKICRCVVVWLQSHHHTPMYFVQLAILTTVTLESTNNTLPDDGVTAPKHVAAFLMSIIM